MKTLKLLTCLRCGYEWLPRIEMPVLCPNCKSKAWNQDRSKEPNLKRVEATKNTK